MEVIVEKDIVAFGNDSPCSISYFSKSNKFPLVVAPRIDTKEGYIQAYQWLSQNSQLLFDMLSQVPAILFRSFDIFEPAQFEQFVGRTSGELYGGYGDLPKNETGKDIYKSTQYPNNMPILFHNESSHLNCWPRFQWFFCVTPSPVGGATPIVDCRSMYQQLSDETRELIEAKGLLYVRSFIPAFDVSWQNFFKTDSLDEVKEKCAREGIQVNVLDNGVVQTRAHCPGVISVGEKRTKSFFNQIQLHHPYWLEKVVRETIEEMVGKECFPRNVLFGDGSEIPEYILAEISVLYDRNAVRFNWQAGDMLMVDNTLVAHGRDTFEGNRKIVVAMSHISSVDLV